MPKAMLPYYRIIIDTISHHPEMKDWYIKLGSFKDNDDFISFYLYPLPTIADSKKFDDRHQVIVDGNKITPVRLKDIRRDSLAIKNLPADIVDKIQLIDDYGGSDGEVSVSYSKKDQQVRIFALQ